MLSFVILISVGFHFSFSVDDLVSGRKMRISDTGIHLVMKPSEQFFHSIREEYIGRIIFQAIALNHGLRERYVNSNKNKC